VSNFIAGHEIAAQWYDEVKNYDFRRHAGSNTGTTFLSSCKYPINLVYIMCQKLWKLVGSRQTLLSVQCTA